MLNQHLKLRDKLRWRIVDIRGHGAGVVDYTLPSLELSLGVRPSQPKNFNGRSI
jgi:hypothetical protein